MSKISAAELFELAKRLHPQGLLGDSFLPVTVQGENLELRYFTDRGRGNDIEFSFFRPDARYARRTFIVLQNGKVFASEEGHIPERDKVEGEKPITASVRELMLLAYEAVTTVGT